jgi:hypothetical protein
LPCCNAADRSAQVDRTKGIGTPNSACSSTGGRIRWPASRPPGR